MADEYWLYILRCADGSLYTGITTNVARRLAQHATRIGARYTSTRLPVALVWTLGGIPTVGIALALERRLKGLRRSDKLLLIAGNTKLTTRVQQWLAVEHQQRQGSRDETSQPGSAESVE
jgi:putative endonuclease